MANNYCVTCGVIIPEGRQICPHCEYSVSQDAHQTRFTKIQALSVDGLARLLLESSCRHCNVKVEGANCLDANCLQGIKAWLMEKGDVF